MGQTKEVERVPRDQISSEKFAKEPAVRSNIENKKKFKRTSFICKTEQTYSESSVKILLVHANKPETKIFYLKSEKAGMNFYLSISVPHKYT